MLRVAFVLLIAITLLIIPGVPVIIVDIFDRKGKFHGLMMRFWARAILWAGGVRVKVEGLEKLKSRGPYVIISNHESALDIMVIAGYLPLNIRFLAKKELFRIPLLGWILFFGRHIAVDRKNPRNSIEKINRRARRLFLKNISVIVFPEGTRSKTGELLPFKKGGFVLAAKFHVPILAITLLGTGKITPKKELKIKPGTVKLRILEEINIVGETEVEDVKSKVETLIQKNKKSSPEIHHS
ncbi:MAG: hypothetical protein DRP91_07750 [Candidatus Neomarinimicrobiota bacterium]|nr:MAG: hypothetical protein DRP91_07750 [Candidatus Neomarinimicrobiota bacterium]